MKFQNDMDCVIILYFLYLVCFVVSPYVIFTWVYWILMAYASSKVYLLTRSKNKFSSCEPKEEWRHTCLYNKKDLSKIECFQCCLSIENSYSVFLSFENEWLHKIKHTCRKNKQIKLKITQSHISMVQGRF